MIATATNPKRLFNACCMALIVTALSFAIRAAILSELGRRFSLSGEQLGWIAGGAFWGCAMALILCGSLCDLVGMGRLAAGAFVCHFAGTVLTILSGGFWSLFFSTVLIGVGTGLVEGSMNPLIATLYPNEKTTKLNHFHAWFPVGVVMGGLVAYGLQRVGASWQLQVATMLVPTILYGVMFYGQKFPKTERVASGVSAREMVMECLRPLFIFMMFCMFLTAATEAGTNQWIAMLLEHAGIPGILVLVWISALMAVGRFAAGPLVEKLAPAGMLLFSAFFSAIGLYAMSYGSGWLSSLIAASIFAVGICYFWPTMLGFVAESVPRSGALGLALLGGGGMIAISASLPIIGHIYDTQLLAAAPPGASIDALKAALPGTAASSQWVATQLAAGSATLRQIGILPIILLAAFTVLVLRHRAKVAAPVQAPSVVEEA